MTITLSIELADGTVENLPIDAVGPVIIGRDPACHVVLDSEEVSRRHASFERTSPNEFTVTDTSANGTVVTGHRIRRESREIKVGDPVRIGRFVVRVLTDDGSLPRPTTAPTLATAPESGAALDSPADTAGSNGTATATAEADHGSRTIRGALESAAVAPSPVVSPTASGSEHAASETPVPDLAARQRIVGQLREALDFSALTADECVRPDVVERVRSILDGAARADASVPASRVAPLVDLLAAEALGCGALDAFLEDDHVRAVLVDSPHSVTVEHDGAFLDSAARNGHRRTDPEWGFTDTAMLRLAIERLIGPLGAGDGPLVEGTLPSGSHVRVMRSPVVSSAVLTLRKPYRNLPTLQQLVAHDAMDARAARLLSQCVHARKNLVVVGDRTNGKTAIVHALGLVVDPEERVIIAEQTRELAVEPSSQLARAVRIDTRACGPLEPTSILRHAIGHGFDRLIVGECHSAVVLEVLEAMAGELPGVITSIRAPTPRHAIDRLIGWATDAHSAAPALARAERVVAAVDLIIHVGPPSGMRWGVQSIVEPVHVDARGRVELREIAVFDHRSRDGAGAFAHLHPPTFADDLH